MRIRDIGKNDIVAMLRSGAKLKGVLDSEVHPWVLKNSMIELGKMGPRELTHALVNVDHIHNELRILGQFMGKDAVAPTQDQHSCWIVDAAHWQVSKGLMIAIAVQARQLDDVVQHKHSP